MKLLIIAILVLAVVVIAQLTKVHQYVVRLSGRKEEDIPESDNRMNARLFWVFPIFYFAFIAWLMIAYYDEILTVSASEHGVITDDLLNLNWLIIFVVFVLTNTLLFYFAGKYYYKKTRKATYFTHDNKLEFAWTIIPAVVMIFIIIKGLAAWNNITALPEEGAMTMELYSKQFDWTSRYPGEDGKLGATDFRMIDDAGSNPLGIVTPNSIAARMAEVETSIAGLETSLEKEILPDDAYGEKKDDLDRLKRLKQRIVDLRKIMNDDIKAKGKQSAYLAGSDDIVIKEFHLPLNEESNMLYRSRDVIHSAYIPHLRSQMNCVPGVSTQFKVKPILTVEQWREKTGKELENFVLMCNKICGASHYNMQMPLIVEERAAFDAWLAEQKPFEGGEEKEGDKKVAEKN